MNIFSTITKLSSYWAGFIAADGCVTDRPGARRISFCMSSKDEKHIQKLADIVNKSDKVHTHHQTTRFDFCSADAVADIQKNFNIRPRKTLTLQRPSLKSNEDRLAYIIGLIDGDGTVRAELKKNRNTPQYRIRILGTYDIVEFAQEVLEDNGVNVTSTIRKHNGKDTCWSLEIGGNKKLRPLAQKVKHLGVPQLERKWKQFVGDLA